MWPKTALTERLGIAYPIIQAPMAGGPSTPHLVAAVSNAGSLGSLGAAYMPVDQMRDAIREIRRQTDRPFAVNLFIPEPASPKATTEEINQASAALQNFRDELAVAAPSAVAPPPDPFEDKLAIILEERVPVFSFTFGLLPPDRVRDLKSQKVTVIGTATTVREGLLLVESGVDAIVGQGIEAGGHRGTFASPPERALIGTIALIPQLADRVPLPVIAAGGIMDGRGIAAAVALGAAGVQMGTAFLACPESGADRSHKEAVLARRDDDGTVLTRAFTGRTARGFRNRFTTAMEAHVGAILPFPLQMALTNGIRQAAIQQNRAEFLPFLVGQGSSLSVAQGAAELVADLVAQTERCLQSLRQAAP